MWSLLEAEIEYRKTAGLVLLSLSGILLLGVLIFSWESWNKDGVTIGALLVTVTAVFWVMCLLDTSNEGRVQQWTALPLPLRTLGLTRSLTPVLFWALACSIFWVAYLLLRSSQFEAIQVWFYGSLTGFVLTANALFLIYSDLKCMLEEGLETLLLNLGFGFLGVLGVPFYLLWVGSATGEFIEALPFATLIRELRVQALGSLVSLLLGAGLTWLSGWTFEKRVRFTS